MTSPVTSSENIWIAEGRSSIRRWLEDAEPNVLSAIDAIGRNAIQTASEAASRLDRTPAQVSGNETLASLEALAHDLLSSEKSRGRRFFRRPPPSANNLGSRMNELVGRLERELDDISLRAITVQSDRTRLTAAGVELDHARRYIQACATAALAAEREMILARPDLARFLRDVVQPRLIEREQDVLTQAAVTQQGISTLHLIAEGQDALARALRRARDISVTALRTAAAARRALEEDTAMMMAASNIGGAIDHVDEGEVSRALLETVAHARREIARA